MKILSQQDIDAVNGKFNHFHDGFIKQIRVISDNEFHTHMPWEEQRHFESNEEELLASGLCCPYTITVELEIHHYNYDWPSQPRRRAIIVRASSARVSDQLMTFIGQEIFHLAFIKDTTGITCGLTYHTHDCVGPVCSMENGITTNLFAAEEIDIEVTTWAEPTGGGD